MQADTHSDLGLVGFAPCLIDVAETLEPLESRFQRLHAGLREVVVVRGRENREHAIAHEFQRFAFARSDGGDDCLEIIVEQLDHLRGRQPVGQGRETAHVGHHDHGPQLLPLRPLDLPGEHAPPSLRPEIGVEQVLGDPPERARLDDRGERRIEFLECGNIGVAEPARPVGRPSDHRKAPEAPVERQREVIGGTEIPELGQQRIFRGVLGKAAAKRRSALDRGADRAAQKLVGPLIALQYPVFFDYIERTQPARADAADLRMQRPHVEGRAEQRQTVADKAPAQLVEQFDVAVDVGAFAQNPAPNLPPRYRRAQAGIGAFGAKELFSAQGRVGRDIQGHARIHSRNT